MSLFIQCSVYTLRRISFPITNLLFFSVNDFISGLTGNIYIYFFFKGYVSYKHWMKVKRKSHYCVNLHTVTIWYGNAQHSLLMFTSITFAPTWKSESPQPSAVCQKNCLLFVRSTSCHFMLSFVTWWQMKTRGVITVCDCLFCICYRMEPTTEADGKWLYKAALFCFVDQ